MPDEEVAVPDHGLDPRNGVAGRAARAGDSAGAGGAVPIGGPADAGVAGGAAGPGPGRRPRARRGEGDRLREEIVAAASRMLDETGEVAELSLRSVAREVGVATTSIYLHFPSLEELILAVKTRYFAEFGEVMAAAAAGASDSPVARLRASAHQYVRYGLENRGRYLAMFSSESLPPRLLPPVGYIGVDVFTSVRDEVAAAIGPERDADMLAIHLWTALHGIVTLRTLRPTFPWPELDRQIDSLIDWLLPAR